MTDLRTTRDRATSRIVSWNTDDAYEYIVQVLGHAEKIPQRYDYTLGTEEILRRLKARYGGEHGMRCVGLLRWHMGLVEDNEVVDGNADRIGQLMAGPESASSGAASRSFGRLRRSISNAVGKLKGQQP